MTFPPLTSISNQSPTSKSALFALILGILSILCLGPLAAIPGIILGIIGMKATAGNPPQSRGRGLALTGLITSIVGLVLWGIILLLIAILLPSLSRAREMAQRSMDASSLRQLSQACIIYSSDNRNVMPPDLFSTAPYFASPNVLKSKFSATPELTSMPTTAADFEAHCDWIYVGADLHTSRLRSSEVILLYSPPSTPRGRNIAFADGHVEWVNDSTLTFVFDASNRARNAAGLPSITLDGPPPSAPPPRRSLTP